MGKKRGKDKCCLIDCQVCKIMFMAVGRSPRKEKWEGGGGHLTLN